MAVKTNAEANSAVLLVKIFGSSPNELIKFLRINCQGPGRKGPPQADAASIGGSPAFHKPIASLPQSAAEV